MWEVERVENVERCTETNQHTHTHTHTHTYTGEQTWKERIENVEPRVTPKSPAPDACSSGLSFEPHTFCTTHTQTHTRTHTCNRERERARTHTHTNTHTHTQS